MVKLIILTYQRIWDYIVRALRGRKLHDHPNLTRLRHDIALYTQKLLTAKEIAEIVSWEYRKRQAPLTRNAKLFLYDTYVRGIISYDSYVSLAAEQTLWDTDGREP